MEEQMEYLKINPLVELIIALCIVRGIPYDRKEIEERLKISK
jgi:hypothetical protein